MTSKALPEADLLHVLRGAQGVWEGLRGQRILITGATGFVGRWLLESLQAADYAFGLDIQVVALSRDPERFLRTVPHLAVWSKLIWARGSVATLVPKTLEDRKFDFVIHLATEADMNVAQVDPQAVFGVITEGTQRVLDVASRSGARRFLFTSSGAVYGPQPPNIEKIPETYEGRPDPSDRTAVYALPGEAKRHAELLCMKSAQQDGLGTVIARCFTFAGPGLPMGGKFAFGNFMKNALCGDPIVIKSDGTPVRSYLYASDLTIWLWTLLVRGEPGRVYNVGSECSVSIRELAEAVRRLLVPDCPLRVMQNPDRSSPPERYVPETRRARDELGLIETVSLEEAIQRTAAWARQDIVRD